MYEALGCQAQLPDYTNKIMVESYDMVGSIIIILELAVDYVAKKRSFYSHKNNIMLFLWLKYRLKS
jgi:hypothetical protein